MGHPPPGPGSRRVPLEPGRWLTHASAPTGALVAVRRRRPEIPSGRLLSLVARLLTAQAAAGAAIGLAYSRRNVPWLVLTLVIAVLLCGLAALVGPAATRPGSSPSASSPCWSRPGCSGSPTPVIRAARCWRSSGSAPCCGPRLPGRLPWPRAGTGRLPTPLWPRAGRTHCGSQPPGRQRAPPPGRQGAADRRMALSLRFSVKCIPPEGAAEPRERA